MSSRQADTVLHGLTRLVEAQTAMVPDAQLLRRFAAHRDEGAFAVLVHRHGPLVYGVCRNVLRRQHDAEDAFQATFLVLARRAGAIREGQALGGWLYRVAYRVAMKARRSADLRRLREDKAAKPDEDRASTEIAWRELQSMLDEELNRLPAKYRAPFVLCCLTGKSKAEAAAELRWKEGTVSSRLARARELLQGRLARRGVTLSALLSGLAISQNGTATAVPAALMAVTQEQSLAFAAGRTVTGAPAALARSVLRGSRINRFAMVATLLAVVGLTGATTVAILNRPSEPESPATPPVVREDDVGTADGRPLDVPAALPPGPRMTVSGSVLGPEDKELFRGENIEIKKPFSGAEIAVTVSPPMRPDEMIGPGRHDSQLLGRGRTDANGQFELSVAQTTLGHRHLTVWASAAGYTPFVQRVEPHAIANPKHEFFGKYGLALLPGWTVRGRLLDPEGHPATRVRVHYMGMVNKVKKAGSMPFNLVYYDPPVPLPGWQNEITTDDAGIFTVRDVLPNTNILLQVRDERYATSWLHIQSTEEQVGKPVELTLSPPRVLVGRLSAQDTNEPLANADIVIQSMAPHPPPPYGALPGYVTARTDENGEFRVRPFLGERLEAFIYPAKGEPYLPVRHFLKLPTGTSEHRFDLSIPLGIQIRGKVEDETNRPVAGAAVIYQWGYQNNPYRKPAEDRKDVEWRHRGTVTDAAGKFTLTVPPGPGQLLVKAVESDFIRVETSSEAVEGGKGGIPYFPNAFVSLQLRPTDEPRDLSIRLRRGVAFRGRVVASDGTPVKVALLFSTQFIPDGIEFQGRPLLVRDGVFELAGCNPNGKVAVWLFNPQSFEAAFAEFDADVGGEPVVRLAPMVHVRLFAVDGEGKRVPGVSVRVELVLRPGDDSTLSADKGTLAGISVPITRFITRDFRSTESGKSKSPPGTLIPGATYSIQARTASALSKTITFTAPMTGVRDLGNVTVESLPAGKKETSPATVGQAYVYKPVASDPDGDPLLFDLVRGPTGMTVDPQSGAIYWVPSPKQVGTHTVALRVSDPYGGSSIQAWQITVAAAPPATTAADKDKR